MRKQARASLPKTSQPRASLPDTVRAFWTVRPGFGEIRAEPCPARGRRQVAIRARYGGISRGTETLVFRGHVPPGLAERMRCPFQAGAFPGPVKYGYATVGTVLEGPRSGTPRPGAPRPGTDVFALHPHQDVMVIPAAAARPIPAGVPAARAVLAPGMETALNALWDAHPLRVEDACVVGAGVIGLLTGYLARRHFGLRVDIIDINPARERVARLLDLGFGTRISRRYPLLFHASGSPEGLCSCLEAAEFEARILELSWYGTRRVSLPLGEEFHDRRLTIRSSQVGTVAPRYRRRWSRARRLDAALQYLRDDRLDALIDSESPFDDLPGVMSALADGRRAALCHRIVYPPA